MNKPEIFSKVEINGVAYRLSHIDSRADGSAVWMVSRVSSGTMFKVVVAADGSFGAVKFAY